MQLAVQHRELTTVCPTWGTCNWSSTWSNSQRTICLSENTERLWISAMLWVVWQRSHTQGSAMRPRSISTWAVWAHTWHWKKASCISGISWDVLITMPLMAMSWSMSGRRRERSTCPLATALSSVRCGYLLGLDSCQGRSVFAVKHKRFLSGGAEVPGNGWGNSQVGTVAKARTSH